MRKMGHFTVVGSDPDDLIRRARELKSLIRVVSSGVQSDTSS